MPCAMMSPLHGRINRLTVRCVIGILTVLISIVMSPRLLWAAQPYRVGAGDVLAISIYGQEKLSGQFKISTDGKISYPVLGEIDVVGLTRPEIETKISQRLAEQLPGAGRISVDVAEFAPVFIMGDVEKPGRYEFRPGMIALELLALGGGTRRLMLDPQRDPAIQLIALEQQISDLRLTRFSEAVTRARLVAEINSQNFDGVIAAADDQPIMMSQKERIIANEKKLFRVRADVLKNRRNSLTQQRDSYNAEIDSLTQNIALHNDELKLISQEVNTAQALVDRGLATEPKLLALKREQSAARRGVLETQSFLARAREHQLAVDLQIEELQNTLSSDLAKALRDIDLEIARTDEKLASTNSTLSAIRSGGDAKQSVSERAPIMFDVIRLVEGKYRTVQLTERDFLEPRDIMQVSRRIADQAAPNTPPQSQPPAPVAAAQTQ